MSTYAIIDFETTGLSPAMGDRATEIAAVVVSNGDIVGRYQSLINPQRPIPAFVQSLTGITDSMVRRAPEAPQVMRELFKLIGDVPLIAHNAAFDKQFLDAEYQRAGLRRRTEFACSMLVARRLYPNFANHKLGDLVRQQGADQVLGAFANGLLDERIRHHRTYREAAYAEAALRHHA